jgi:hypothetical protein
MMIQYFPHHHPRVGGGPDRAKRLYKCRLTAAGQTPAYAGVVERGLHDH